MFAAGKYVINRPAWTMPYRLWTMGDIHWAARGCLEKLVDRAINAIKEDKRAIWIGMGDYFNLIKWGDNRFDPSEVATEHRDAYFEGLAKSMVEFGVEKFKPIARKCLGLLQGNHEYTYEVRADESIVSVMAEKLKVPYFGFSGFRDIVFKDSKRSRTIRVVAHHGAGHARTIGAKLNRLVAFMHDFEANLYLMGHVHTGLGIEVPHISANEECNDLKDHPRTGVITGSFASGYTRGHKASYVERALLPPTVLGPMCVNIIPDTGEMGTVKPILR